MFKKMMIVSVLGLCSTLAFAKGGPAHNLVSFPVMAQSWVNTSSANVIVNVNASIKSTDIAKLHQVLLDNLNLISKTEWHVTQFNRNQDSSGLDKVFVSAQGRVMADKLNTIQEAAKNISQPGVKYTISDVQFTPSQAEVQNAKTVLRQEIYGKVKTELTSLDQSFPKQHYRVYSINFMPISTQPRMMNTMVLKAGDAMMVPVSNRVTVNAIVGLQPKRPGPKIAKVRNNAS